MLNQHIFLAPIYKRENPESNQSNSRSCNNNRLAQIIWLLDSSLYKIQTSFNKKIPKTGKDNRTLEFGARFTKKILVGPATKRLNIKH